MANTATTPERSIAAALAGLGRAQKPGGGVPAYTRWINRRLGRWVAAISYAWRVSPNAVTVLSAVFSGSGLALLVAVEPGPVLGLAVAALLAFGYVLDSADGQIARLSGRASTQGEWLDHVVDAIRTPTVHLVVLAALWRWMDPPAWLLIVALAYAVVSVGQFMSQILAEQLAPGRSRPDEGGSTVRSLLLIPIDTGALCWVFALWGYSEAFPVAYGVMFVVNTVYTGVSMRRKYRRLGGVPRPVPMEVEED